MKINKLCIYVYVFQSIQAIKCLTFSILRMYLLYNAYRYIKLFVVHLGLHQVFLQTRKENNHLQSTDLLVCIYF